MSLTENALRAVWPARTATRPGRRLPGLIGPRLGPAFPAALERVNGERLQRAEAAGQSSFKAWPGFITTAGTSRCNIRCES
jgi:hypothetical protein